MDHDCKNSTGHPINIAGGNKWLPEQDYAGSGPYPLRFSRDYNSSSTISSILGRQWSGGYGRFLAISSDPAIQIAGVFRGDGTNHTYAPTSGGAWKSEANINDTLEPLPNATGWKVTNTNDEVELYDATGKLQSITNRVGLTQTLTYDANGLALAVTDPAGRQLSFSYDTDNRISTMTDPAGGIYHYAYDSNNNLSQVTYPDGKIKQYLYGEAANVSSAPLSSVTYANSMTGIIDENGNRYASYWYDANGWAFKEELAPDSNLGIDKATMKYTPDSKGLSASTTVTDALGTDRTYNFIAIQGTPKSTGQTQPGGSGCSASASNLAYDANGNTTSRTDFNGNRTCYAYDTTRNLEIVRLEGLPSSTACPADLAAYVPPTTTGSAIRKITTQWHATFHLPTLIAEPLRITTTTYDANGNVLTKTIQPTTDTTGAAGANATANGTPRTTTNTYNAYGQVLTVDGPRTDVTDVTTYTYYDLSDLDLGKRGNLASVSNALNQVTTFDSYDATGRATSITDPNGLVTTLSYDLRGRLISRDTGGEVTGYSYDGVGNLVGVSQPSGASYTYTYDAAHRLTDITDNTGNTIHYTLDAIGNRTKEQLFDAAGNQLKTHSRVFDALNRLYQDIGAVNQTTTYAYDANGNLTGITDPLNHQTTRSYDALNRLIGSTDAALGVTQYGYDGLDQLTKVTDPRSLITQYQRDGLGNLKQQTSPDTGITGMTYDVAGNLLTRTDAKGQLATYTYDALNRVSSVIYTGGAATPVTITYQYDQGINGIGHLTGITEPTGITSYAYDQHGRLSGEARQAHGLVYSTSYVYDAQGRLATVGYPSGRIVNYGFDSAGRINQISTDFNNVTLILASNIAYQPFGGVKSFTYGDGVTAPVQSYTRQYDQDGRIASYTLNGNVNTLGYDAASQITRIDNPLYPQLPATYGYDPLSRLNSYIQGNIAQSYNYDADGNRSSQSLGLSNTSFSYAATSNRLTGIQGGSTFSVTQDANGATTADGTRQYSYDLRGRLTQATTAQGVVNYEVNALGLRVRKQVLYDGTDTMYYYDAQGHLLGESPTGGATFTKEYVYLGDLPVAVLK